MYLLSCYFNSFVGHIVVCLADATGDFKGQSLKSGFMPPKELLGAYRNRTLHLSVCPSHIFFEVGIPNLVCGCISGWGSVVYHFWVTVTLTFDLAFRIIMSAAYILSYLS